MRRILLCCMLAFMLLASSCGAKGDSNYSVTYGGESYVIDTSEQTITHQGEHYRYEISGNTVELIYPNGSRYWRSYQSGGSYGGWSDDYSSQRYVSGDVLLHILDFKPPGEAKSKNVVLIFFLIAAGAFYAISPKTAWYLSRGWQYKNAEPSEAAIEVNRMMGIAAVVIGVLMIFL